METGEPSAKTVTGTKKKKNARFVGSRENRVFITKCDRREKRDHQSSLFKMAALSTSTAPTPIWGKGAVNQNSLLHAYWLQRCEEKHVDLGIFGGWCGSYVIKKTYTLFRTKRYVYITHKQLILHVWTQFWNETKPQRPPSTGYANSISVRFKYSAVIGPRRRQSATMAEFKTKNRKNTRISFSHLLCGILSWRLSRRRARLQHIRNTKLILV